MALTQAEIAGIVESYQHKPGDTGSSPVQIALLTARIQYLTAHMQKNKHDYHTRLGLIRLVNQRRKLLAYLKRKNPEGYRTLINQLGLRR